MVMRTKTETKWYGTSIYTYSKPWPPWRRTEGRVSRHGPEACLHSFLTSQLSDSGSGIVQWVDKQGKAKKDRLWLSVGLLHFIPDSSPVA